LISRSFVNKAKAGGYVRISNKYFLFFSKIYNIKAKYNKMYTLSDNRGVTNRWKLKRETERNVQMD